MSHIEYKGFTVTQDRKSHHVMVAKDGQMVMHVPCDIPKTETELREMVDFYEIAAEKLRSGEFKPIVDWEG